MVADQLDGVPDEALAKEKRPSLWITGCSGVALLVGFALGDRNRIEVYPGECWVAGLLLLFGGSIEAHTRKDRQASYAGDWLFIYGVLTSCTVSPGLFASFRRSYSTWTVSDIIVHAAVESMGALPIVIGSIILPRRGRWIEGVGCWLLWVAWVATLTSQGRYFYYWSWLGYVLREP